MDLRDYRVIIYHLAKQGKTPKAIFEELINLHGQDAPSKATVVRWVQEFKRGRKDLDNRAPAGRPPEAITNAKIELARAAIRRDPNISTRRLARELGLAQATTKILVEHHLGVGGNEKRSPSTRSR